MKLDEQELRHRALSMATASHDGRNTSTIIAAATEFYNFMREPITALSATPPPSGMPERREAEPLLYPSDTLDSVMVQEVTTPELQSLRRQKLFELDVLAKALKDRGVVPC